jgi:hypothetical protein
MCTKDAKSAKVALGVFAVYTLWQSGDTIWFRLAHRPMQCGAMVGAQRPSEYFELLYYTEG